MGDLERKTNVSTVSDEKSSHHTQTPTRFQPRKATPATSRAPGGSEEEKVDRGKDGPCCGIQRAHRGRHRDRRIRMAVSIIGNRNRHSEAGGNRRVLGRSGEGETTRRKSQGNTMFSVRYNAKKNLRPRPVHRAKNSLQYRFPTGYNFRAITEKCGQYAIGGGS